MFLDILIPVYQEQDSILRTLKLLNNNVKSESNILICYDYDEDPSLIEIEKFKSAHLKIILIKNKGVGAATAIKTGLAYSKSEFVLIYNADDFHNAMRIDEMLKLGQQGYDVVAPSRYIKGGKSQGVRISKAFIAYLGSWICFYVLRFPLRDITYCFRMFSRRVIESFKIESEHGFTFIIEYTVKAHRKNFKMIEIPGDFRERIKGKSKFKLIQWTPYYARWVVYVLNTQLKKIFK